MPSVGTSFSGCCTTPFPDYLAWTSMPSPLYDSLVVGGSYAGMSAALALGRARRTVLLVDAAQPCNRFTPHSHNFLTHDGRPPADIAAIGRDELSRYPTVTVRQGTVADVMRSDDIFEARIDGGATIRSRTVILATGIVDTIPDIPGFAECWGVSVLHCPYCHGYEIRDKPTGIVANGADALHLVRLLRQWSKDLVLFTNGPDGLDVEQYNAIAQAGVSVVTTPVAGLQQRSGQLDAIVLTDGSSVSRVAIYARLPFTFPGPFVQTLGCDLTPAGRIAIDPMQRTSAPGVYAAGDIANPLRTVAAAVAAGNMAGAVVNMDLIEAGHWSAHP